MFLMNSARKKVGLYRKKYLLIERAENGLVGNLKSCKINDQAATWNKEGF